MTLLIIFLLTLIGQTRFYNLLWSDYVEDIADAINSDKLSIAFVFLYGAACMTGYIMTLQVFANLIKALY